MNSRGFVNDTEKDKISVLNKNKTKQTKQNKPKQKTREPYMYLHSVMKIRTCIADSSRYSILHVYTNILL